MMAKGYINNQSRYVASALKDLQRRWQPHPVGIDEKTIAFKINTLIVYIIYEVPN